MKNISIIKFGSQLNSNFDKYSDKDILVIADSIEKVMKLHHEYSKCGWSVSSYTYSKLEFLSRKGSLFIKHLVNCSEIIHDDKNRFQNLICNYSLKSDYKSDLNESLEYFKVISRIPNNRLGYGWFSDCMFVGLRNYFIFENACVDTYDFSFLSIIEQLHRIDRISKDEYNILKQLRVVKHNYRNEYFDELPSKAFVDDVIEIAVNKLHIIELPEFVDPLDFQSNDFNELLMDNLNGYQRLRLIEGLYCSKGINLPVIKRIISNPQFYANKLVNIEYVNNILRALNRNDFAFNDALLEEELIQIMNK